MLESSNSSRIDFKLRKGVSLLTIHLLQSPDLPTVNTMMNDSNEEQNPTKPILINRPLTSDTLDQSVFTYTDISKLTSSPFTPDAHRDPIASSEDITDFDTDHTGYTSARSKNDETDSLLSYSNADRLRGVRTIDFKRVYYFLSNSSIQEILFPVLKKNQLLILKVKQLPTMEQIHIHHIVIPRNLVDPIMNDFFQEILRIE